MVRRLTAFEKISIDLDPNIVLRIALVVRHPATPLPPMMRNCHAFLDALFSD